jgi:hypothetical protein
MKLRVPVIFFFLFIIYSCYSQDQKRITFFAGYGYYEGISTGMAYNFSSNTQFFALSVGIDKLIKKQNWYFSTAIEYNISIFRSKVTNYDLYKWYLGVRAVYWYYEDDYYIFNAMSFIPNFSRQFSLSKKFYLSINAGLAFNLVLTSKRKTFEEVGWPYNTMPNARVLLIF